MLVNANWLKKNIKKKNIKIIDASWYLPNSGRNALEEYKKKHIPKAVFFDIDKISDKKTKLPHMIPNFKYFEKEVNKLGINNSDIIIVYCKEGILSSPRVWWTFSYFGHKKIFVLNGGLNAWKKVGGRVISGHYKPRISYYKCHKINKSLLIEYKNLNKVVKSKNNNYLILDARPKERFLGKEHEPRKNIGKGKIFNSKNLPFNKVEFNGYLKNKSEIRAIFKSKSTYEKYFIFTCGSGVAACNLAIAKNFIGSKKWSVYDGSWTEWFLANYDLSL